jgi:UDP-2,4-diacetamido-2,4,6-trideoxy-beta-L-altropyranose hydrolase
MVRADASQRIGTGHVMRCLSLAKTLKSYGATVEFVCRDEPGLPAHRIREAGFSLVQLPRESSAMTGMEARSAADGDFDVIIVDHYGIDASGERVMRQRGRLMVVIDDLADRPHDADILIDSTLGRREGAYLGLVPNECKQLLGSRYAIVDPRFFAIRPLSLQRRRQEQFQLRQLAVSLGGADPHGSTSLVLQALASTALPATVLITVIVGAAVTDRESIERTCAALPWKARILTDVRDMPALLSEVDLVIGAGGTSSWERCCLGVPALLLVLADNQVEGAAAMAAQEAARLLGRPGDLVARLPCAIQEAAVPETLQRISRKASALCDGLGTQRVAAAIDSALKAHHGCD